MRAFSPVTCLDLHPVNRVLHLARVQLKLRHLNGVQESPDQVPTLTGRTEALELLVGGQVALQKALDKLEEGSRATILTINELSGIPQAMAEGWEQLHNTNNNIAETLKGVVTAVNEWCAHSKDVFTMHCTVVASIPSIIEHKVQLQQRLDERAVKEAFNAEKSNVSQRR
ncbi:hypothetical protein QQZ08_008520 [Neonectria magnoliae]|uniref:Uncharacterized protein n=1 Tax=Neonectria magnoliae TaxID=2732573 RepID=A0ABR1HUY9_9HYPO